MILLVWPIVPPVANIIWECEKCERTDMCENNDHYRQWQWNGQVDQLLA